MRRTLVALAGLSLIAAPATAGAGTYTFVADRDARVEKGSPTRNYGASTRLVADGSPAAVSYVGFTVRNIPAGEVVQSAKVTLQLSSTDSTADGPRVHRVTGSWKETGVTWATRPAHDATVLGDSGAIASSAPTDFDVTAAVTGNGSVAFAFFPDGTDGATFRSREYSAVRAPRLTVVTTVAPRPPGLPSPPLRPSFPQGLWAEVDDMTDADLASVRSLGYEFVLAFTRADLDRAHAAGLQAMFWLGKWYDDNDTDGPRCTWQKSDARVAELVNSVKGHPALAYYFLDDEPHDRCANVRTAFLARNALVKSLDPAPLTLVSENRTEAFDSLANVTDVLVAIAYPCNVTNPSSCSTSNVHARVAALEAAGVAHYWAMRQVFDEHGSDAYYRYPSAGEYVAQNAQWDASRVEGELGFMGFGVYAGADGVERAPQALKHAVAARNAAR